MSADGLRLRSSVYVVPTDGPEADGTLAWDATTVVVVEASADGTTGVGWTYSAAAAASVVDDLLAPAIADVAIDDPADASERMSRALRNVGRTGIGASAMSAVDNACWDLRAKRRGRTVAEVLGAEHMEVPVYGSGGFTTYDDARTIAQLEGWLADGAAAVKIKIGEDRGRRVDRDLDRIGLARRVVGDAVDVFVDANGAYDVAAAVQVDRAMRQDGVNWFEEPVTSDRPDLLAAVRDEAEAEVAAGEYVWRPADAVALLDAGAVDCLQLDVTRCGGISSWLVIAETAASAGLDISAHCAPQQSLHVGAATPRLRHLEWFHDHVRVEGLLFAGTAAPEGGVLGVDGGVPGSGSSCVATPPGSGSREPGGDASRGGPQFEPSEARCGAPRIGVGAGTFARGIRDGEVGPEGRRSDDLDAGPPQPVLEVRLLEVVAERGTAVGTVDGARVDHRSAPAVQQSGVAGLAVEGEDGARLADHVDELLEDVGDAVVPHRHAEEVEVRGGEAFERESAAMPGRLLGADRCLAGEDPHLRAGTVGAERGERAVPEVPGPDLDVRTLHAEGLEEGRRERERFGCLAARRRGEVEKRGHDDVRSAAVRSLSYMCVCTLSNMCARTQMS